MSDSQLQRLAHGVLFRQDCDATSIRSAYLKAGARYARVYPDEWTADELRVIADHMESQPRPKEA